MKSKEPVLSELLAASCLRAWDGWTTKYPKERFYAFALYTTMDGEYFVPSICGEDGLTKVARQYVKQKSFANIDDANAGLAGNVHITEGAGRILHVDFNGRCAEFAAAELLAEGLTRRGA